MLFAYRRTGPRRSALIATTHVGARAEVAAGGADQHHLQRWRVAEVIQRGIEQAHHLAGDRVELVGPVERRDQDRAVRSEEHTSELQSLMRNSYSVFFLK